MRHRKKLKLRKIGQIVNCLLGAAMFIATAYVCVTTDTSLWKSLILWFIALICAMCAMFFIVLLYGTCMMKLEEFEDDIIREDPYL